MCLLITISLMVKQQFVRITSIMIKMISANQPIWIPLIAGATARTAAVSIVSPLELIRTKMQSKNLTYSGMYKPYSDFFFIINPVYFPNQFKLT